MSDLKSTLEELREFDGAILANTLSRVDPTPAHELYMDGGIQSVTPGLGPTVGVAITCEVETSTPGGDSDFSILWQTLEEISKMDVPAVWVIKCFGSRPGHESVFGDGTADMLYAAGCHGLVTDGRGRDIPGLMTVPFAAYCRGLCIHHCAYRYRRFKEPVEVGGLTIRTGDIIHGSAEGVIKIPPRALAKLPEHAVRWRAFEHAVHRAWRRTDLTIAQKREVHEKFLDEYGFSRRTSN